MRIQRTPRHVAPLAIGLLIGLVASCSIDREPNKSDYVRARVREMCGERSGNALRACRIAVINYYKDTPLEEMQRKYPKPEVKLR